MNSSLKSFTEIWLCYSTPGIYISPTTRSLIFQPLKQFHLCIQSAGGNLSLFSDASATDSSFTSLFVFFTPVVCSLPHGVRLFCIISWVSCRFVPHCVCKALWSITICNAFVSCFVVVVVLPCLFLQLLIKDYPILLHYGLRRRFFRKPQHACLCLSVLYGTATDRWQSKETGLARRAWSLPGWLHQTPPPSTPIHRLTEWFEEDALAFIFTKSRPNLTRNWDLEVRC